MNKTIGIMAAALALAAAAAAPVLRRGHAENRRSRLDNAEKTPIPELRSLRQELIKAEAFKLAADGTLLPSLSVSGRGLAGSASRRRTTEAADDDRSAEATLEQTVYSGGRNSAIRAQSPQVRTIGRYGDS